MDSNYEVFLKTDLSEYTGKWVAIAKKGVIAVGDNAKEVMEHAMTLTKDKIMLVKVPEEETLLF